MISVGFDLYCQLLAQAVAEMKGEEPLEETLTPVDLARVPQRCRPSRIFDEDDIAFWSGRLTEEYWQLRGTAADAAVLQELWSFFLRASIHVARLRESVEVL